MTNPYAPIAVDCEFESRPQKNGPIESLFWVKHFFTFQFSFACVWLFLVCANLGIAKVVQDSLAAPPELLVLPSVGIGIWVLHAILALAYRRMRRVRACTTAIVGSSLWLAGMLIFECLSKILPRKLSMSLSWTPELVLLTLYSALSLIGVWLVVRMHSDHPQTTSGDHAMHTKPLIGRFDLR